EGIYAVEKDTLKICLNRLSDGVKERPGGFATQDKENLRLLVFERDRDARGDATEGMNGFVGLVLRYDRDRKEGAVGDTLEGGPARKAGLRKDDVILKIGGGEFTELRPAVEAVRQSKPGSELTFRVRRAGKESDITVKVGVVPFNFVVGLE